MKRIEINPTNEYHVLRHFDYVSKDYIQTLLGKQYFFHNITEDKFESGVINSEAIHNALETKGSKFFPNIPNITSPKEALNLIKTKFEALEPDKINWKSEKNGSRKFFPFLIHYKEPVGYKNLIAINELDDEQKKEVLTVNRSNHQGENAVMVKVISGIEARKINTIEVGIVDFHNLPFYLVTAYPGELSYAPEFPNPKQNPRDFKNSKLYWDTHVFIE